MSLGDSRAARALGGDQFSFTDAVGGWRGLLESAAPGAVFVVAFLVWGGWAAPVVASVAIVAVLALIRALQRSPLTQVLSGVVGVGVGAVWAWRSGNASSYFVPGLWANAAYLVGTLASMIARWPLAGIVMGLVHGTGTAWRENPVAMRLSQWATAVLAAVFAARLAVEVPLYFADKVAALGTAKLALGVPLFALALWLMWLIVRPVGRKPEPRDQPRQT
jgi:hypothetical protein